MNGGAADQNGTSADLAPGGSQSFPGFAPGDETDRHRTNFGLYADAETSSRSRCSRRRAPGSRTTATSASRVSGQGCRARFQPSPPGHLPRGAVSTGFRAPGLEPGGVQQGGHQRHRGSVRRGRHLPGRQCRGPSRSAPSRCEEETSFNLSAGVVVHARWTTSRSPPTTSASRSTTRSCSAPPSMTRPRCDLLAPRGHSATSAACSTSPTASTRATQGVDITAGYKVPGRRERDARPDGRLQRHATTRSRRSIRCRRCWWTRARPSRGCSTR